MAYITRFSHFTFEKEGDALVVSSERDDYSIEFDWPDDLTMTDENLVEELYERFYTKVRMDYGDRKT
jgi:hypothetical protein